MTAPGEAPINFIDAHNCFGCGSLNVHGLQLRLHPDPESNGVFTLFTPNSAFEGYGGMVHGGIVATVLDEVMAWSLYRIGAWAVTAQMETRFRHPLVIDVPTRATGRIDRDRGRLFDLSADIRRISDDLILAEAKATFMRVPEGQANAWRDRYNTGADGT
ncbi:MAG: PaaI family thioesterase [Thermomicrobiales bacterium]